MNQSINPDAVAFAVGSVGIFLTLWLLKPHFGEMVDFMRKYWLLLGLLVGCGLFAIFVWPTRYRYDRTQHPETRVQVLVRIDRFSGQIEYLSSHGWKTSMGFYRP